MKVAYFSPLPPDTSGIADYSALLLPELERLLDVEVARPGRTRPVADADVALYHVGNNPDAHGWILDALRRRPGVVVLHEFVLHHLVAGVTIGRKDAHAYLAAMERDAGVPGRLLGWGVLEGRVPPLWEVRPGEFPLAGEVLDLATGLIVHSRYVETHAREHGYDGPLWRIPHPAWPAAGVEPAGVAGAPLLGCFGHINESKRIPQLLRAFASFRRTHPGARLLLVGGETPGFSIRESLPDGVLREPYVEEDRLWSLLAACDACVLLRAPTMGETSGSAIRALSLGRPLVVSDVGWFAELPDEVALKIAPGADEVEQLEDALEQLAEPGVAAAMGEAARALVEREHEVGRVAGLYAAALEESAGAAAVDAKVLRAVAEAAADAGVGVELVAPELERAGLVHANGRVSAVHVPQRGWRTWPMWFWAGSLYAVAVVVQLSLGLRVVSPWIFSDELIYSNMARGFAETGHMLIRGGPAPYGPIYPLLLSPTYAALHTVAEAYRWSHVVNALVMCSVIAPVYLLARRVVRPWAALAAAALSVAVPSMVYVGTLMTENAFYPVFAWFAFALVLALERPTARRQLATLALLVLAFLTRAQAVALAGALVTAPLALAWIERGRPRRLRAWRLTYALLAAGAAAVVVFELARGRSPSQILGGYSVTTSGGYRPWPALEWVLYHVAALDLSLWILPFAALLVLVANARHLDAPLRAFAAAAAVVSAWLVVEVGLFASVWASRIEERNIFYLAPLFLIALLAWIERGSPAPPRAAAAAALAAAALPGAIPFLRLMNINSQSDTPFLQPWWYLGDRLSGRGSVSLVAVCVGLLLAAAFLWLPRRYAPALPLLVAAGFLLTWLPLQLWAHSFAQLSTGAYNAGIAAPRGWVDRAVGPGADVALVWTGSDDYRGWENEFWNRSVRRVYDLGAPHPLIGAVREPKLTVQTGSGDLLDPAGKPIRAEYVLADRSAQIDGKPVAADSFMQMTLYRVGGVVRTTTQIRGWHGDDWTGPAFEWRRRDCTRGVLSLRVHTDPTLFAGVTQRISVSGTTPKPFVVPLRWTAFRTIAVPLTPSGRVCDVRFSVTPSRRPSDFPALHNPDPRRLGVLVSGFDYESR